MRLLPYATPIFTCIRSAACKALSVSGLLSNSVLQHIFRTTVCFSHGLLTHRDSWVQGAAGAPRADERGAHENPVREEPWSFWGVQVSRSEVTGSYCIHTTSMFEISSPRHFTRHRVSAVMHARSSWTAIEQTQRPLSCSLKVTGEEGEVLLDYSKNRVTTETMKLLLQLVCKSNISQQ